MKKIDKNSKLKLLYVVEAFGGGIFTYLAELANRLDNDFNIYIAYGLRKQTPQNFKEYFPKDIHWVKIKDFTREVNLKKDLKAFVELRKVVKEINPDIIHLNSSKAGILGRWGINNKKHKVFYTPHGYSFLMQNSSKSKRIAYKLIEKISARKNTTTISCSLGEHRETLKLTPNAVYVENGIEIEELDSIKDIPKNNEFTVFTLGRISEQKNPQMFNEVAKALPNIKFIWIGDGELREKLKAPNITITGWVERKKALEIAKSTDAFFLPSKWEGLPMSLLEAMYLKKYCIVSDIPGNNDVIKNNINGFIGSTKNDFINILKILLTNSLNCEEVRDKAYKQIINHYNTEVMKKEYIKIYLGK
ncbi:glycosyltransferase family 4 protein [Lactobacillus sp. PV037]|uniref:glycosyltransferase n=1 Tax=Lactobacillus sp. PV037 TaxID=2594496 RepID=UPI00223EC54F|nr:glycosyltransferase [Lactobacillus sp. PV037]QNQ83109.1 glycosyltransferase family 4 protein [Lactobacillus sp. PV037]